jgi:hypothetical protein
VGRGSFKQAELDAAHAAHAAAASAQAALQQQVQQVQAAHDRVVQQLDQELRETQERKHKVRVDTRSP